MILITIRVLGSLFILRGAKGKYFKFITLRLSKLQNEGSDFEVS